MKKEDAISEILDIFYPNTRNILNKYAKSCKKPYLTFDYFLNIISKETYSLKELGVSAGTTSKLMKELFPDRVTNATGTKPCTHILSLAGVKHCARCKETWPVDNFRKNSSQKSGYNTYCKKCHQETTSSTQSGRQSEYKTNKLHRTVPWSELSKIKEFYNNCPSGHHVDHIIPLNGKVVSGLHVLNNLQYLPAQENCAKGNKYST